VPGGALARVAKDFDSLEDVIKESLLENTWCDSCQTPDLGLQNPSLFEEDGKLFVAGECRQCGSAIETELIKRVVPK
jgi:hypothetical protein